MDRVAPSVHDAGSGQNTAVFPSQLLDLSHSAVSKEALGKQAGRDRAASELRPVHPVTVSHNMGDACFWHRACNSAWMLSDSIQAVRASIADLRITLNISHCKKSSSLEPATLNRISTE